MKKILIAIISLIVVGVVGYALGNRPVKTEIRSGANSVTQGGFQAQGSTAGDTLAFGTSSQFSVGNTNRFAVTVNGVSDTYVRQALVSGTTTPCAIISPASTSTLEFFGVSVTQSTSTTALISMATSSTQYATTTTYFQYSLPANNQAALNFTPTTTAATVLAPSTYLTAGFAGDLSNKGFVVGGICEASFYSLN